MKVDTTQLVASLQKEDELEIEEALRYLETTVHQLKNRMKAEKFIKYMEQSTSDIVLVDPSIDKNGMDYIRTEHSDKIVSVSCRAVGRCYTETIDCQSETYPHPYKNEYTTKWVLRIGRKDLLSVANIVHGDASVDESMIQNNIDPKWIVPGTEKEFNRKEMVKTEEIAAYRDRVVCTVKIFLFDKR